MTPYEARRHTHFPRKESSGPGFFEDFRAGVRKRQQQAIYGNRQADPLSPLSQGGALASMITKGLSQLTGAEELSRGNPTGAALAATLGPASLIGTQIAKGGLQFLPSISNSLLGEGMSAAWQGLKHPLTALLGGGALGAIAPEAKSAPVDKIWNLKKQLTGPRLPVTLRPPGSRNPFGIKPKTEQEKLALKLQDEALREANKMGATAQQKENLSTLVNRGPLTKDHNDDLLRALRQGIDHKALSPLERGFDGPYSVIKTEEQMEQLIKALAKAVRAKK